MTPKAQHHASAAKLKIQVQLQLRRQKGHKGFLPQDRRLFSKAEATLIKGEPTDVLQWISSVRHAKQRAAQAKHDLEATVEAERTFTQQWLHGT
jgi:hypothetical protein